MDIKKAFWYLAVLVLPGLLSANCKKESACSEMGVEYVFSGQTVAFSPGTDSIALGNTLIVRASVPKNFFDQTHGRTVSLSEGSISGPFNVSKLATSPYLSFTGGINDVELSCNYGFLTKDSATFSPFQLESFRTAYWDGSTPDSFKIEIKLKPLIRGTFFISIRDQGNKNSNCALFRYLPEVINSNQHFYLMTPITNGEISEVAQKYVYCFKVY